MGLPNPLWKEKYNSVSGMQTPQISSSESFSPVSIWRYSLFHCKPQSIPEYPLSGLTINCVRIQLNENRSLSQQVEFTRHKAVSQKASFQFLSEDISFFTIAVHVLLNVPWWLFLQKSFSNPLSEEKYNSVSGMHTSQSSSSEIFSPLPIWRYFRFHHKPQSAPEYPLTD